MHHGVSHPMAKLLLSQAYSADYENDDDPELKEKDDSMAETLREAKDELAKRLSYCTQAGDFPWIEEKFLMEHAKCVWQVLTILLGTWCANGGMVHISGKPVKVYLPIMDLDTTDYIQRARLGVQYAAPENPQVRISSVVPIRGVVAEYVESLRRMGFFDVQSDRRFAPPCMIVGAVDVITHKIVGDRRVDPDPWGGFPERLRLGMEFVRPPMNTRWGIGSYIMRIPTQLEEQDWHAKLTKPKPRKDESEEEYLERIDALESIYTEYTPQISFEKAVDDGPPQIPEGRYFKMDEVTETHFVRLIRTINGAMPQFIRVYNTRDDDDIQQWICDFIFDMLHDPQWCPNLMSYIGAQYAQDVCVSLQSAAATKRHAGKPRAYFTLDDRYKTAVSPVQRRIMGMFMDVLGMTLFSHKAYMSGLLGVAGTNKSTFVDMLVRMVGGADHVLIVDSKQDKCVCAMHARQ